MAMSVSVEVQDASGLDGLPNDQQIQHWVSAAIDAAIETDVVEYELVVRLVDKQESQSLNRRYRQQDRPTNVLSFPFERLDGLPATATRLLGDLVICGPLLATEAQQQGKALHEHWAHIVIHGVLHLLGYDHQDEQMAESMETLEKQLLHDFGIQNPYGEH